LRLTFAKTLIELADQDPRIILLTADLGYMVLEAFAEKHPTRFFNVGVAEQNMVGVATGLAEAGFIPFIYSIVTFATLRPYEFIRNGPIFHQLPVRIAGIGGGFDYGTAGPTHHGLEDVGVMRIQPGITVIAPADSAQARSALLETWDLPGPVYYRLGKDDNVVVSGLDGRFGLEQLQIIREGNDLLLIAMGAITQDVVAAAHALEKQGIHATIAVIASLNPAPTQELAALLEKFQTAMTIEAHYIVGGIGSLVSEVIAENGISCRLVRCGIEQTPDGETGSAKYLNNKHGISSQKLIERALQLLQHSGN
jgi:transketolase